MPGSYFITAFPAYTDLANISHLVTDSNRTAIRTNDHDIGDVDGHVLVYDAALHRRPSGSLMFPRCVDTLDDYLIDVW